MISITDLIENFMSLEFRDYDSFAYYNLLIISEQNTKHKTFEVPTGINCS